MEKREGLPSRLIHYLCRDLPPLIRRIRVEEIPMANKKEHPAIFIFNVSKAGARHVSDGPRDSRLLLAAFASTLQSTLDNHWLIQSTIYSPTGCTVLIDTDDEQWHDHVGCPADEELLKIASLKGHPKEILPSTLMRNETSDSTKEACVSVFKVASPSYRSFYHTDRENEDIRSVLKLFIDALISLLDKSDLVLNAVYGPSEGANIFMRDSNE